MLPISPNLYLYAVVVAQQVVDLDAREAGLQRVDGKLRHVEVENRTSVYDSREKA